MTAWLLWRAPLRAALGGAAGFAVSIFVLLFIARVFQTSYLVWPLTGIAVAVLLAQLSALPRLSRLRVSQRSAGARTPSGPRCRPLPSATTGEYWPSGNDQTSFPVRASSA